MNTFKPNDRVVMKNKQLHGNLSTLSNAEVISVSGSSASVIVDGDDTPKTVSLTDLTQSSVMYGGITDRPNELPVVNAIRR